MTGEQPTAAIAQYPETLAMVRLGAGSEIPDWAEASSILAVCATATETTLVCATRSVPRKVPAHRPLTAFAVPGEVTGAGAMRLPDLLAAATEVDVPVLVVTTFEAHWLLVPRDDADRAADQWRRRGHEVAPAVPVDPRDREPTHQDRKKKR